MHAGHVLFLSGSEVAIYRFDESATETSFAPAPTKVAVFGYKCDAATIYNESLYLCTPGCIEVTNIQGSLIATLPFADREGCPISLHVAGSLHGTTNRTHGQEAVFIVAGTDKGFVKVRA